MNAKDSADSRQERNADASAATSRRTCRCDRARIGPDVIDVGQLYRDTGCFTYDPGFTSTANCSSRITYIDGDKGVLLYRGYPIEQLAEQSNFLEVCYLLLYGELPTKTQFDNFRSTITRHTMVHEQMTRFFTGLPPRRAPDGGHVRLGRRAVGLLSRLHRHQRSRSSA